MIRRLAKTAQVLIVAVLCLLLLCGLWLFAARTFFHQEFPSIFGYSPLTVASGSMEPALSVGDLVVVHQEDAYQVGEVIAFWDEGVLTTHRAVGVAPEGFVTKGDFNNVQDNQPVAAEQVAGRVVLAIPLVGNAILFMRTPLGLVLLVALGLLMVFLPDLRERVCRREARCAA